MGTRSYLGTRPALLIGWLSLISLSPGTSEAVRAQPPFLNDDGDEEPRVIVSVPRELSEALNQARTQIDSEQFTPAAKLLQFILDHPEDYFSDADLRHSLKRDALDLVKSFPTEGRQAYGLLYEASTEALARESREHRNRAQAEFILQRYWLTDAGRRIAGEAAFEALDQGRPEDAARLWDALASDKDSPAIVLPHVVALIQSGRLSAATERLATAKFPEAVTTRLGEVSLTIPPPSARDLSWLRLQLPAAFRPSMKPVEDWRGFRGNASRNATAARSGPVGGIAWSASSFEGIETWAEEQGQPHVTRDRLADRLNELEERLRLDDKLLQPGCHPLVVGDLVIARTLLGVTAYDLMTGALRWRSVVSDVGLISQFPLLGNDEDDSEIAISLVADGDFFRQRCYRDQLTGQLSTDGRRVFAIEQMPVIRPTVETRFMQVQALPPVTNVLAGYDAATGRLLWELGGTRAEGGLSLAGATFLGAPTVIDDRLYVLAEIGGELRLLQLAIADDSRPPTLIWSQVIAAPGLNLAAAPLRRLSGLTPSASDHLLICPTSCGVVVAVDVLRRQLAWGYQYPSQELDSPLDRLSMIRARLEGTQSNEIDEERERWLDSSPCVAEGTVLLTPRDSSELHCLDLETGELKWKRPRQQLLYVQGVVNGRAILVGREQLEAVRLDNGQPAWAKPVAVPQPAGRGLLLADQFLLPLTSNEILTLDAQSGRVISRARLPDGHTPGNLAAGHGSLVSQSVREVLAYSSLNRLEQRVASTLAQRPNDPGALALRGELRLMRGQQAEGLADLRQSLAQEKNPQASLILAGAMIDRLRQDFAGNRDQIDEMEQLTLDPRQRGELLRLAAEGWEREGNLVAAFRHYVRLANASGFDQLLERVTEGRSARGDCLVRGRTMSLYRSASAEQRSTMDRELTTAGILQAKSADAASPSQERMAAQERFLRYFDWHPEAEAVRRQLIDSLPADASHDARYLHLLKLADSDVPLRAGYAVAQLARLAIDVDQAERAGIWLTQLRTKFAGVPIFEGKTGSQLADDWSKLISPDALQPTAWPKSDFEPLRQRRPATLRRVTTVDVVGAVHPLYENWSFEIVDELLQVLVARDGAGRIRWLCELPSETSRSMPQFGMRGTSPQLRLAGPYLALSQGVSLTVLTIPAEGGDPRICWQRSLSPQLDSTGNARSVSVRTERLASGRWRMRATDTNTNATVGQLAGLSLDAVYYLFGSRLIAAEPLTGRILWVQYDVPASSEASAEGEYVTLYDFDENRAIVYRAADGQEVAQRGVPDEIASLHLAGDQLLTMSRSEGKIVLEQRQLATNTTLWRKALEPSTTCTVVDNREVVCLDAASQLTSLDLTTGDVRWTVAGVKPSVLGFLWVQRLGDRYTVVAGSPARTVGNIQVPVFGGTHVPFTGSVFGVDAITRQLLWKADIPTSAFDVTQTRSTPILAFASRVAPVNRPGEMPNMQMPTKFCATFLDRRSGDIIYQTEEAPAPGLFQWELDGDRKQLRANMLGWVIQFQINDAAAALPSEPMN